MLLLLSSVFAAALGKYQNFQINAIVILHNCQIYVNNELITQHVVLVSQETYLIHRAFVAGVRSENVISPHSPEVYAEEGSRVTLSCNYSTTATNLQWYHQYPRSVPKHLVSVYSSDQISDIDPRLTGKINKEKTQVFLEISSVQVSDSALYYCALTPTVTQNHSLPYKNLDRKTSVGKDLL